MTMKIDCDDFRIAEGETVGLAKRPTTIEPLYPSRKDYRALIEDQIAELTVQQSLLYANNSHSLLLIFQAMDAAGKDSAIKHVMSGVNPQGCQVYSFKHPSMAELAHDFLWRTNRCLPERGQIGIFNRSYYEEVLIVRVQPEILRSEGLPAEALKARDFWQQRYQSITDVERHLHRNGTRIIKFFLHLSKEEQRRRLLRRIDDPDKNWKASMADIEQRKFWTQYQEAYEACLGATSSSNSPWYAVPADDKPNAHLIIAHIILHALKRLRMSYPKADRARQQELKAIRKRLAK
jgi:PPK2 family polyphosphate:nucleotide phosphotransferase